MNINLAMAQVTAFAQNILKQMPPGVTPPLILKYNASSVPIIQLAMSSEKLTESQLFDFGNQFIRSQIATVAGASIPYPFGGAARQIQVDLRPDAMRAHGLSAVDVKQRHRQPDPWCCLPARRRSASTNHNVKLNASPLKLEELNDMPIKSENGGVTYIKDIAFVHDGHPPQTNIVARGWPPRRF